MTLQRFSRQILSWAALVCVAAAPLASGQSSSSSTASSSTSTGPMYAQEKAPSLIDPAGPMISLISAEPLFIMASALNVCGYDAGLAKSDPLRKRVRDEIGQALTRSEPAREKRDALCLYIAQHNMTGTAKDVAQYVSLSLYLSPPPELESTVPLPEMPPDATQVFEVLPLLRAFAAAADLHGIWLTTHHLYDEEIEKLHDPLSNMIVQTNLYLKLPASSYDGRRFIVVVEPMLSPGTVNARVYGSDYVAVVSPVDGQVPMKDVRHIYLHYLIDPLLYARTNAIDRENPILKAVSGAPLAYRYRSDVVPFTVECLIKAIEARTMDTGIAPYKIPAGVNRSELPRYEFEQEAVERKMEDVRRQTVEHDMRQGFVLTQYFYDQMGQFEKQPASLNDTIGEMVYSMDVEQQVSRAKHIDFDQETDEDVLQRSQPHQLTGLDLAEAKLSNGDVAEAEAMARKVLASQTETPQAKEDAARAHFILARADLLTGRPDQAIEDFNETLAMSKEQRLLAWSHIYLGRMLDLECKRDAALAEYKEALTVRDGQQDTRLAAERGVKAAYAVKGESCDDDESGSNAAPPSGAPGQTPPAPGEAGQAATEKPQ
jgi:tetratricopeptide (TPR) repeat protein